MLTSTPSRSHRSAARTSVIVFAVLLVVGVILAGYGLTRGSGSPPHTAATTAAAVTSAVAATTAVKSATATPVPTALPAGVVAFVALPVGTPPSPGMGEGIYPWHALVATLTGPKQVRPGTSADYRVQLTNHTSAPIALDPCPSYDLTIGLRTSSYGMNCAGAPSTTIAAGGSLTLDLPVQIPGSASGGTTLDVGWSLGWQPDKASPHDQLAVSVR